MPAQTHGRALTTPDKLVRGSVCDRAGAGGVVRPADRVQCHDVSGSICRWLSELCTSLTSPARAFAYRAMATEYNRAYTTDSDDEPNRDDGKDD